MVEKITAKKNNSELRIDISKIIQIEGDDSILSLYKNAAAFVFPSKYEGLGSPRSYVFRMSIFQVIMKQ